MKKIILYILLMTLATTSFCQQTNPAPALTKQDYLRKGKTQNFVAIGLSVGGFITGLAGVSKNMNQDDNIDGGGETAMLIGGLACLASIPVFIIASKNKKKAMSMSFYNQPLPQMQNNNLAYRAIPSIKVKISL
jgi:hypothetical protein